MQTSLVLAALVAAAPAPAHGPGATVLRWAPPEGARLERTFEHTTERKLESLRLVTNGEEDPIEGTPDLRVREERRLVVTDTLVAVVDGRPRALVRRFDAIGQSVTEGGRVAERGTSPLEGRSVAFTWKDGGYAAAWADGDRGGGDEALLAGLAEDLDLRGFLPPGPVEPGATWAVDVGALVRWLSPGGDLAVEGETPLSDTDRELLARVRDGATGTVEAELVGERDAKGARVGVIAVRAKVASSAEIDTATPIADVTNRLEQSMELEGELLWDLAENRLREARLAGPVELRFHSENRTSTQEGEPVVLSQELVFSGTASWAVEVELAE